MWNHLFRKNKKQVNVTQEIDIWRVKALFNNFRKILKLNTQIFEQVAAMDRVLGGEFIFDRKFIEESVRTVASHVHHVTYNLNALTRNRFVPLYDRYQEIRVILDDILAGNTMALACPPVLPFERLSWELEPLVGVDQVCLAELRYHPGIKPCEGIVVSSEAVLALLGDEYKAVNGEGVNQKLSVDSVEDEIQKALSFMRSKHPGMVLSVAATRLHGMPSDPRDLGEFLLRENENGVLTIFTDESPHHEQRTGSPSPGSPVPLEELEADSDATGIDDIFFLGIKRIIRIVAERYFNMSPDPGPVPLISLFIRPASHALVRGTITTRAKTEGPTPLLSVRSWIPGKREEMDSYQLRRIFPFDFVSSSLCSKDIGVTFADNLEATSQTPENKRFRRGSAIILPNEIQALAETAMTLERVMGMPVVVHWEYLDNGEFVVTRLFPYLELPAEPTATELEQEMEQATVLSEGGLVVQSGVAGGTVFHVNQTTDLSDFPMGGVLVAPMATPQLTPILYKASAIITEYGNPVGHLATVARELNLPALFGVVEALELIPNGTEVTVDAGRGYVYRGILNHLLQLGSHENSFSPSDPEYRMLRRLLRFISPLRLINPEDSNFSAENCSSFHDIIHFCHEMAVEELVHFQERRQGLRGMSTSQLNLPIPMDIHLLDIGGGLPKERAGATDVSDILSEPMAIFLDGLLHPQAAGEDLPSLGVRDIISSLPRTSRLGNSSPEMAGDNLAIISQEYMNLSLRLGYHFSVIDAHLSDDPHRNYIYFRFIGGLADQTRRARRALFISDVLAAMDFKVSQKGDLVVGRLKFEEQDVIRSALFVLGALTTYSRQRDTSLHNDEIGRELFDRFANTFLLSFRRKSATSRTLRDSKGHNPAGRLRKSVTHQGAEQDEAEES